LCFDLAARPRRGSARGETGNGQTRRRLSHAPAPAPLTERCLFGRCTPPASAAAPQPTSSPASASSMSSSDVSAELDHDVAESESESSPAAEPTSTAAGALRTRRCQAGGAQGAGSDGRGGCALGEQAARRLAGPAGLVLRVLSLEPVVIARVHGVQPGAELRELGRRVLVLLRRSAQAGVRRSHARGTLAARSPRRRPTLSRLRSPSAAPARPSPRRRGPRRGCCPCRRRSCSWRRTGRAAAVAAARTAVGA